MIQHILGRATKQGKEKLSVPKLKVWSTFSKVVGVGNAHKNFMLTHFLVIPFIKGCRLFFKHCLSTQNSKAVCARKNVINETFMGSAQTRNPLKRVELNFKFIKLNF